MQRTKICDAVRNMYAERCLGMKALPETEQGYLNRVWGCCREDRCLNKKAELVWKLIVKAKLSLEHVLLCCRGDCKRDMLEKCHRRTYDHDPPLQRPTLTTSPASDPAITPLDTLGWILRVRDGCRSWARFVCTGARKWMESTHAPDGRIQCGPREQGL